jgi:hypothetical protein
MMLRKARIDAPGALHHVIVRGIERRKIFRFKSPAGRAGGKHEGVGQTSMVRPWCSDEQNKTETAKYQLCPSIVRRSEKRGP